MGDVSVQKSASAGTKMPPQGNGDAPPLTNSPAELPPCKTGRIWNPGLPKPKPEEQDELWKSGFLLTAWEGA